MPETIKCAHCKLVQFRTAKDVCRKCGVSTAPPPAPVVEMVMYESPACPMDLTSLTAAVSFVLRIHRIGSKLSQKQAAKRFGVASRTYISKIERGYLTPTLGNLQRFAWAYRVPLASMVLEIEVAQKLLEG
jgi:hypothetical protein